MPERPARNAGFQYTYVLRPVPTAQAGPPPATNDAGKPLTVIRWAPEGDVAVAPECLFDADARVAWSTGRLDIVGMNGGITIRGNRGFQARMTDSTLTISNRVRTVIQRELVRPITP